MSKNLGAKPMLVPQPVMMIGTYDADGNANVMNAAWGGIVGANEIIFDLGSHKTTENIKLNKAFTVTIADAEHVAACDYVGIVSANDEPDKMKKAGFTTRKSEFVNAPVINELSLTMECKLKEIIDGDKFLGEIVNVVADDVSWAMTARSHMKSSIRSCLTPSDMDILHSATGLAMLSQRVIS